MKNKKLLFAPLLLASLALGGCASTPRQVNLNLRYVNSNSIPNESDFAAQSEIANAANSVDHFHVVYRITLSYLNSEVQ